MISSGKCMSLSYGKIMFFLMEGGFCEVYYYVCKRFVRPKIVEKKTQIKITKSLCLGHGLVHWSNIGDFHIFHNCIHDLSRNNVRIGVR